MKRVTVFLLCLALMLCAFGSGAVPQALAAGSESAESDAEPAPALTINGRDYSPGEVNYFFANEYYNIINQYGSYTALFGLDTSRGLAGLDEQSCQMLENGTWRDYFLERAVDNMSQIQALTDYAKANDITLNDEEIAEVDEEFAQLEATAKTLGYSDVDALLADYYGAGVTEAIVHQAVLDTTLASKTYSTVYEGIPYTAEELEARYRSYDGAQDRFDFLVYKVTAAVGEGEEAPSEVALAEAHADAEAISMAYSDAADIADIRERFEAAVSSRLEGQMPTARSAMPGDSIPAEYKDWMLGAGRAAGDVTVVDGTDGSYVVVFLSRNDNHYKTVNIRHILVMAEASEDGTYSDEAKAAAKARAEEILAEFEAGDKTEESFAALAKLYSEDGGSNTNGGLYENVSKGQMVEEFDAFCFAGHEPGDTGIVFGTNGGYAGYHVMYFVGEGEQYSDLLADSDLRSEDTQLWLSSITAGYEVLDGPALSEVG